MPTLSDYQALSPFSLDELVDAANSILRDSPRLVVSRRTVRYYIAQDIVPPPVGSPKFARYEIEHLARLVTARRLLDRGQSLEMVRKELAARPWQEWMSDEAAPSMAPARAPAPAAYVLESRMPAFAPSIAPTEETVSRLQLRPGIVLEMPARGDRKSLLRAAKEAIQDLLDSE